MKPELPDADPALFTDPLFGDFTPAPERPDPLREALLRIFDLAENRPDIRTVVTAALSRQAEKETA